MKTYILKYDVYNSLDFQKGTIVKITDDYWGSSSNDANTGFTVVKGKLKGKKGCVADGLKNHLLDDTIKNRMIFKQFEEAKKRLRVAISKINKRWDDLPVAKI